MQPLKATAPVLAQDLFTGAARAHAKMTKPPQAPARSAEHRDTSHRESRPHKRRPPPAYKVAVAA